MLPGINDVFFGFPKKTHFQAGPFSILAAKTPNQSLYSVDSSWFALRTMGAIVP
jgi:hypothetical protein